MEAYSKPLPKKMTTRVSAGQAVEQDHVKDFEEASW
jgi:hypothetical protein